VTYNPKNFLPINEGFTCEACSAIVPAAKGTFRNHCPHCLTSKHVDKKLPGDRASLCQGLMPTVIIEGTDPDKLVFVQKCQRCGHIQKNRQAKDDNKEVIFKIMANRR
jgi:hypothetical protein